MKSKYIKCKRRDGHVQSRGAEPPHSPEGGGAVAPCPLSSVSPNSRQLFDHSGSGKMQHSPSKASPSGFPLGGFRSPSSASRTKMAPACQQRRLTSLWLSRAIFAVSQVFPFPYTVHLVQYRVLSRCKVEMPNRAARLIRQTYVSSRSMIIY